MPLTPSTQAMIAATVTKVALRPVTSLLPLNRPGLWTSRRMVATFMKTLGPPVAGTTVQHVRDGKVRGEWVRAPGVAHGNRAIYYIHGSGYVICSARTHRGLASRLSRATGLPVFVVDYRLAPEHRFPAAADDVEAGYRWLLDQGLRSHDIAVASDSAGGHLSLDLLIENARTGTPQPGAMVTFSPLVDLTFALSAKHSARRPDPMITVRAARDLVRLYTRGQPEDAPRLRLALMKGVDLPPILVQAGGAEMLRGDARHLHQLVTEAGGRCELEIWPGQMHVFQALPRIVPEARLALDRAAAFITTALAASTLHEQAG